MTIPNDKILELCRSGLLAMLDTVNSTLVGAERIRTQQLKAIKDALIDSVDTAKKIESAGNLEELLEVQANLARANIENVIGYWNGLSEAATMNYLDGTRQLQARIARIGEDFRNAAEASPAAGAETAMTAAFKSMLDASSSAYALTTRAAEKIVGVAAAKVEADPGAIAEREAA